MMNTEKGGIHLTQATTTRRGVSGVRGYNILRALASSGYPLTEISYIVAFALYVFACHYVCADEKQKSVLNIGIGRLETASSRNTISYRVMACANGNLPVGESVTIRFDSDTWTNKSCAYPEVAILLVYSELDDWVTNSVPPNINNIIVNGLKNNYRTPGGDAYRGIIPYVDNKQVDMVITHIDEYKSTPPNDWLKVQDAVAIAVEAFKTKITWKSADEKSKWIFDGTATRYDFGWFVRLVYTSGGFNDKCLIKVGDDKHVKSIEFY